MSLTSEQRENAAIIYQVGRQMGMSTRDIQIALITAMQESGLRNLHYGDRDSQGLFQQRPSQGWGTVEQVTDPRYAARKFFSVLKTVDRQNMSMTQAAQAVQRSAYPDAYAKHISLVRSEWPEIVQKAGGSATDIDTGRPYKGFTPMPDLATPSPTIGQLDNYKGLRPPEIEPLPDPNVLGAQWSEVLAAPKFLDLPEDPYVPAGETPDYASFLGDHTYRQVRDQAAADGNWKPTKGVDGWRAAVVEFARKQVGKPYAWGVSDPNQGFDCSGLVQYAFSRAGIKMPRVSYQQANSGQRVALNTLRPGDLVAWDNSSRNNGADHIAIYIGNGQIIEAPRPGIGVRVRKLGHNEGAWGVRVSR